MIWFTTHTKHTKEYIQSGHFGMFNTYSTGSLGAKNARMWAVDNGCYGDGYPGDVRYMRWLSLPKNRNYAYKCLFVAAPDVVGDAMATLGRSRPFLPILKGLGYSPAYVAQDGFIDNVRRVPWDDFDTLFIGGTDEFKLGLEARQAINRAQKRGKRIHVGRVNTLPRLKYFTELGAESSDGTKLAFGVDKYLSETLEWNKELDLLYPGHSDSLFEYIKQKEIEYDSCTCKKETGPATRQQKQAKDTRTRYVKIFDEKDY